MKVKTSRKMLSTIEAEPLLPNSLSLSLPLSHTHTHACMHAHKHTHTHTHTHARTHTHTHTHKHTPTTTRLTSNISNSKTVLYRKRLHCLPAKSSLAWAYFFGYPSRMKPCTAHKAVSWQGTQKAVLMYSWAQHLVQRIARHVNISSHMLQQSCLMRHVSSETTTWIFFFFLIFSSPLLNTDLCTESKD